MENSLGTIKVTVLPVLTDNYVFVGTHPQTSSAFVVDPPEASQVLTYLDENRLSLEAIFITHHHPDHVSGVDELRSHYGAKVYGFSGDSRRLPPLDIPVQEGTEIYFQGTPITVMETPAHTLGHILYYMKTENSLFCGDTLFGLGCGRLFEGTPVQLLTALSRIRALPDSTNVFCAHEYTMLNLPFALSVDPNNLDLKFRKAKLDKNNRDPKSRTVPLNLGDEKKTNPFLNWESKEIRQNLGLAPTESEVEFIRQLRLSRDRF